MTNTDLMQLFGGSIIVTVLLAVFLFFGIGFQGKPVEIFTSSQSTFNESYPPFNVSGSEFSNSTKIDSNNHLTVENNAGNGTYSYISPIEEEGRSIDLRSAKYTADIPEGTEIEIRFYTSNDNFSTVDKSFIADLSDGTSRIDVDLKRGKQVRYLILLEASHNKEPVLQSLDIEGFSIKEIQNYSILFSITIFYIIIIIIVIVVIEML